MARATILVILCRLAAVAMASTTTISTTTSTTSNTTSTSSTTTTTTSSSSTTTTMTTQYPNPWVKNDDLLVLEMAQKAKADFCKDGFIGTPNIRREDLASDMGGDNVFVDALMRSLPNPNRTNNTNGSHVWEIVMEELEEDWVQLKAAPLIFALLVLISWCVCCGVYVKYQLICGPIYRWRKPPPEEEVDPVVEGCNVRVKPGVTPTAPPVVEPTAPPVVEGEEGSAPAVEEGSAPPGDAAAPPAVEAGSAPGWGSTVTYESIGKVKSVTGEGDCIVDFPDQPEWPGKVAELQVAKEKAPPPVTVGCNVRVKPGVTPTIKTGWQVKVTHQSIGRVKKLQPDKIYCVVDFEGQPDWTGIIEELEVVEDDGPKKIPIQDHFKVQERKWWANSTFRSVMGGFLVVCMLAVLLTMLATDVAYKHVKNGIKNLACTSTQLSTTLLGGDDDFIGMIPVMDTLWLLNDAMHPNSTLMREMDGILEETAHIEGSLVLMSDTTKLLGAMLQQPSNLRPESANPNSTLLHECQLCATLAPVVSNLSAVLSLSVADSLFKARAQVKSRLGNESRESIRQGIMEAMIPLAGFKDQLRSALKPLVQEGGFDDARQAEIEQIVYLPIFFVLFGACGLITLGCLSTGVFMLRPTFEDDGKNYSYVPHRFAMATWCTGFCYIIVALLAAGMINVAIVPASGLCVLLADLDSELVQQVGPYVPPYLDFSGDTGPIIGDLTDICLKGRVRDGSDNLLEIIYFRDDVTGEKTNLRKRLVEMTRDPLDQAFAPLASSDSNDVRLNSQPSLVSLLSMLSSTSAAATLLPNQQAMEQDPLYQGLSGGDGSLAIAYRTGTACSNSTFAGQEIVGIEYFVSQLKALPNVTGTGIVTNDCIEKVACSDVLDAALLEACDAGNAFLDLKKQLLDGDPAGEEMFRCDLFTGSGGSVCDPLYTSFNSLDNNWEDDCLQLNQTNQTGFYYLVPLERSCGLKEFDAYVRNYSTRLDKFVRRLDDATSGGFNQIASKMRNAIDTYALDHINDAANGMTCSFLTPLYQEAISGMCYQGLAGVRVIANSYVVAAVTSVFLTVGIWILWRIIYDNIIIGFHAEAPRAEQRKQTKKKRFAKALAKLRRANSG